MSFRVPAFSTLGPGEHFPRRHLQYFSGWKTVAAEAREVGGPQPGVWAPYTQSSVPGPCPLSVRAAALLRRPRNAPAGSERPVPENRDLGKRRVSSGTGSFRDVGAPGPLPTAYPPRQPQGAVGSLPVGPSPKHQLGPLDLLAPRRSQLHLALRVRSGSLSPLTMAVFRYILNTKIA